MSTEDGDLIVQKEQDEEHKQGNPKGWAAGPVKGIGFACRKDARYEWATIGGKELNN